MGAFGALKAFSGPLGFRVWGLIRVWGLGFRVWGSAAGLVVQATSCHPSAMRREADGAHGRGVAWQVFGENKIPRITMIINQEPLLREFP